MHSRRGIALTIIVLLLISGCSGGGSKRSTSTGSLSHDQLIQTAAGESYTPKGKLVADMGFRPENDGFGFQNYGDGPYKNMVSDDVRSLFGDGVCAYLSGDTCDLTPQAEQWMEQTNKDMAGGHCYGFSVAALLFYAKQQSQSDYGADATPDIKLDGNEGIQRNIATTWAFQTLPDVRTAQLTGTPNEILDALIKALTPKADELYTLGIFKADGTGGHAITPYAVEDKGDGRYAVLVYDNNYPNVTRAVLFDKNANSWGYTASTNPEEPAADYIGTARSGTIMLDPTSPALDKNLTCPFCTGGATSYHGGQLAFGSAAEIQYNQVILTGDPSDHGHLILTDDNDNKTGYVDGKYINDIPGVIVHRPFMDQWQDAVEPIYDIPTGTAFEITIDGTGLKEADPTSVSLIGPGYEVAVEDINLEPDQIDTMIVTPDGKALTYKTKSDEAPFIDVGIEGEPADYEFGAQGVSLKGGGEITVGLDSKEEILVIVVDGVKGIGEYGLGIRRIDDKGEQIFTHDGIKLGDGESAGIAFGKWAKNGASVPLVISHKGGKDETVMLTDEGDTEKN